MILAMTVFPGFGGQAFISEVLDKIRALAALRDDNSYGYEIEVDGGINQATAKEACDAGADILVAGSYIFRNKDLHAAMDSLRS